MQLIHCICGSGPEIAGAQRLELPEVPAQKALKLIDATAHSLLPHDPTPSLEEIQASPNVAHMGEPGRAPQEPSEPLRVVVSGSDAALGAVLTRLMRADIMWAEVAYIPTDPRSPAALVWGLPVGSADAVAFAVEGAVAPAACVRNDSGQVMAGSASITSDGPFVGEIVVNSEQLVFQTAPPALARWRGQFGARLAPSMSAPGITASSLVGRFASPVTLSGRAVQAGGENLVLTVDGVRHPRTVSRSTFYRHLRDIQAVRNAGNS